MSWNYELDDKKKTMVLGCIISVVIALIIALSAGIEISEHSGGGRHGQGIETVQVPAQ